ncbi:hypothetical protein UFOVP111_61 [uncultured Caudovirales phage]|uniref:Uncharacterized protein n=1 Tax=uncultured Caudovirales phage TaxID=2100421 RepID=A0A6J5L2B7_9CAUD|nr:hypothetical protein UFOVP111_61 [uncultured Caudovirales phage]
MINGDISNATPPRIIVMIDVVAEVTFSEVRKGLRKVKVPKAKWRKENLSHLWNVSYKFGLSIELAATEEDGWDDDTLTSLMDKLDNRGGNPFNYHYVYEDIQEIIDELPYKANFKGIVADPGTVAKFGSWGIEIQNI